MAKAIAASEQSAPATPEAAPAQKLPIRKLILFGFPVFLVQLLIVYFLITRFLAPAPQGIEGAAAQRSEGQADAGKEGAGSRMEDRGRPEGKIYVVKDLIVNPAGTNGTRFLLTTIGLEVTTPEALRELESKDVMVRDALNTILTSKDLLTIVNVDGRETIRKEIEKKVGSILRGGVLTNVYFSKFIIQ
jgi:flagellar FliL protein